jgi:cytosine/uracil/thiamine/allantoin permease
MDDEETFQDIWNQAFKTYQEQTGRKLQNDSQLKKLQSTNDLLDEIDAHSKTFGSFRNKHSKLWNALSSCLAPMSLLGNALQSALSATPFVPTILTGVLHLINVS